MNSKFFTNEPSKNLFAKFTGIMENMKDLYAFHAVVGYFRSSGYFALQQYLSPIKDVKILVGINVDRMFAEAQRKGQIYFGDAHKTKKEFMDWFIQDVKEAKYTQEVEEGILQFIQDVVDGKIEVRAYNAQNVLHAKFYLFLPQNHSEHSDGWVIMGSSNLTDAGLGIKQTPNYELNIALKDYTDVQFAKTEFERLWEKSTPILPADLQGFVPKTHIGQSFSPFELYMKFLMEYFDKNIDYDPDTVGDLPKTYKKLSYQIDAVNQGFQMLLQHNGFFLADVVGLGKTVVAAMIAKRFLIANGSLHTKILIIYPPALEKNWKTTFRTFGLDKHTKFITNGRLDKIIDQTDLDYWAKEDYDLVLVDEAHRYRNHKSQMFNNLQLICKAARKGEGLVTGTKKKIMLISATPLNNRPQDIYYLLQLFQDTRRSTLPESDLQRFFGPIIRDYKEIVRADVPDLARIRDLYSLIREKIITEITVRRTRRDLKSYPKYRDDLQAQGIIFPEIAAPKPKLYVLDTKMSKLFYHTIFYLTDEDKIHYNRYQAIAHLKDDLQEQFYDKAEMVSKSLAAIMKTLMVKRLESSFCAFKTSLQNFSTATTRMIEMFESGKILIAPDLNVNNLQERNTSIEDIEQLIWDLNLQNPRNNVFTPDDFKPEFIEGLRKDSNLLKELISDWSKIEDDPKLDAFFASLHTELLNPSTNPSGKLVIFTESTDTADYLHAKMEDRLKTKVLNVSAKNRNRIFETILENFDANYLGLQKNDYQILITTDVLAEGVNLHRANVIVNYDTPWNATRLMQRIGRVNRIGSTAGVVYNYNFYPSQQGDEEIKLYSNALVKLQGFHSAFGEDAQIYTHEEMVEQFELFNEGMKDDEDKRLYYLQVIRDFKDFHPIEFKRIKDFPLKARTARSAQQAGKDGVAQSSVLFLKSTYKTEFYKIDVANKVDALTFMEAAHYFEAQASEVGFPVPQWHYAQIEEAIQTFEQDVYLATAEIVTSTDKADAYTKSAVKFLRDFKGSSTQQTIKQTCDMLMKLVSLGVYTALATDLQKINKRFFPTGNKARELSVTEVEALLLKLAQKYNANTSKEDTGNEDSPVQTPGIILSETFME